MESGRCEDTEMRSARILFFSLRLSVSPYLRLFQHGLGVTSLTLRRAACKIFVVLCKNAVEKFSESFFGPFFGGVGFPVRIPREKKYSGDREIRRMRHRARSYPGMIMFADGARPFACGPNNMRSGPAETMP